MNREVEKLTSSHDRFTFVMQSTSERDQWQRCFPDPMPGTHEYRIRWQNSSKGVAELVIEPVERAATPPVSAETQAARDAVENVAKAEINMTLAVAGATAELDKLTDADLETRAAEAGVSVFVDGKKGKKLSKAQLVAAVAAKLAK